MGELSFFALLHVVLWVYAVIRILDSAASMGRKILWIVVVALLPVLGLIIWFFAGPGSPGKD